jgi:hypothetical protein
MLKACGFEDMFARFRWTKICAGISDARTRDVLLAIKLGAPVECLDLIKIEKDRTVSAVDEFRIYNMYNKSHGVVF